MIGISRKESVIRYQVRLGNLVEQLACNVVQRLLGIGSEDGVEGEDIGVWGEVEDVASERKAATFGV